MKNDLIQAMSVDMNIPRFQNESDESFVYRLCYSALGQWCLSIAKNVKGISIGTTKNNQTIVLNDLLARYTELFPDISKKFVDTSNQQRNISVSMRRVYEETGYLLTDEDKHNRLANFGRSIKIGQQALFFGLPQKPYTVNGLGVFSSPSEYVIAVNNFLIRDSLTCEEYFQAQFDAIDFYDRDIDVQELEFFNPLSKNVPSLSWNKNLETDCSVARKTETGPFYRMMRTSEGILFADEPVEVHPDSFISHEYRRLYFAMKAHYGNSVKATISKLDNKYSRIRVGGHLPYREYYFLLLLAWPESTAFDKVNFIIPNSLLGETYTMLEHIGIEVKGGRIHE
ncbi:hypothetical protein [Pectinatus brassicae]|uniref:Uncharacterized protein n=1 Tax=Pectinatus brassicae TaxID=862415 RepID=A0A840UT07_9FIRM|nr:hypothetical protein [Pectinatus brassicae]MBB5335635.1 hypothetical protein [Pectinatus brassicae]